MLTTVESSTTISWAIATVTSVHQRRECGTPPSGAAGATEGEGEVWVMRDSIYETQ